MRNKLYKIGVGVATLLLTTVGIAVISASPASAAVPCGPSAPNYDPGSAQVVNPVSGYTGAAMRTGPGFNCPILVRVPWGATVPMNCYRSGDSSNGVSTWTAVLYQGYYFGWVNDYHLSGRGSNYPC